MADLREVQHPERKAEIDTVGWLFLVFAVAVTAIAGMIVYDASYIASPPGPHIAAR